LAHEGGWFSEVLSGGGGSDRVKTSLKRSDDGRGGRDIARVSVSHAWAWQEMTRALQRVQEEAMRQVAQERQQAAVLRMWIGQQQAMMQKQLFVANMQKQAALQQVGCGWWWWWW
jgi:hypothetical protein